MLGILRCTVPSESKLLWNYMVSLGPSFLMDTQGLGADAYKHPLLSDDLANRSDA